MVTNITDIEYHDILQKYALQNKDKEFDTDKKYVIYNTNPLPIPQKIFNNSTFTKNKNDKIDYVILWGHSSVNLDSLNFAKSKNIPIQLCEDGFIRSFSTYCDKRYENKYIEGCSLTIDRIGFNYDSTCSTDIEKIILNTNFTQENINLARSCINTIKRKYISKYNHQKIKEFQPINKLKKNVLVVDQSYNDWSIKISGGTEKDFQKMLDDAVLQNPDFDIYIKIHPDTLVHKSKKFGYFLSEYDNKNIHIIKDEINPLCILEKMDKVYVYSTQLGFEALMMDKEVHVYGTPFYAGWGLTIDNRKFDRRKNTKRTLEQLFYSFYVKYTHWYNPMTKKKCTIVGAIEYIENISKQHQEQYG